MATQSAAEKIKLVLLGATGKTGKELMQQALDDGHTVTAVVRDPNKVTITHDNLKVKKADVFDESSLTEVFKDQDAVVSCLGFPRNPQPVSGYTKSAEAIIPAMRATNINRFVTITCWFTDISVAPKLGFIVNWLIVPFLKPILINMFEMENYLKTECSDIDYTVVRPPGLGNKPKTGLEMSVSEEEYYVNTDKTYQTTNRSDVAAFMLDCLKHGLYSRKMVSITTEKKSE